MHAIRLVQIINKTGVAGAFLNLETAADGVALPADEPTNTPGQKGEGCHIPDCGAGRWWATHRMTITTDQDVLSLWKEGKTVYYRRNQSVYPGEGCGTFLWQDNGLPVTLSLAEDLLPTMTNP